MNENYIALTLEKEGEVARNNLMSSLIHSDILGMCYAYKSRVKPEDKLIEKKSRKLSDKPEYSLLDITDVIGIRFVTLFREEMPKIFEKLIDIICHTDSLNPNPFCKDHIEEVIIYHTNPYDDIKHRIEEIIKEKAVNPTKEFKPVHLKDSYSSIHIVTRLNHKVPKLSADYHIPLEIQIRTVFEDAWGEIDHKYGYVLREGKDTGTPIKNAEFVLKHLKILKKFSDACAEYADAIHFEASPYNQDNIESGKVISVATDDALIEKFRELGVSGDLISAYQAARDARKEAQEVVETNHQNGTTLLMQAAEKFRELAEPYTEEDIIVDNKPSYLFYYYSKMNEAVCLLSSYKNENIKAALNIYTNLEDKYSGFPLLHMRIGQAYSKLGQSDEALEKYQFVSDIISDFENEGCQWSDALPEIDYKHIKKSFPTLWGFQLWKKSRLIDSDATNATEEKIKALIQAYDVTNEAMSHIDECEQWKIVNNLIYYAVEISSFNVTDNERVDEITSSISDLLSRYEQHVNIKECDDIEVLDTISKAYKFVGRKDDACKALDRIIYLTLGGTSNAIYDHDLMLEIAQEAYAMRQEYMAEGM